MKYVQLFVLFFLTIHGVASLPSPPEGLLPVAERSQPVSHYQEPTTAEAQAPANSRDTQEVQSARSILLSGLSTRSHPSTDEQVMQGSIIPPRFVITKDVDEANTPLLPRALMRHPPEWRNSIGGFGVIGAILTTLGGLGVYLDWRKKRDRKRKEEEEARARAHPPGAQPPYPQPGAKRDLGSMSRLEVRWVE
jgi:hypothetical protein